MEGTKAQLRRDGVHPEIIKMKVMEMDRLRVERRDSE